eukprot:Hpha_TRINITY_DN32621_c0_g1::TRINITY_DN32621_c0_g1_i1::g.30325::m.30325
METAIAALIIELREASVERSEGVVHQLRRANNFLKNIVENEECVAVGGAALDLWSSAASASLSTVCRAAVLDLCIDLFNPSILGQGSSPLRVAQLYHDTAAAHACAGKYQRGGVLAAQGREQLAEDSSAAAVEVRRCCAGVAIECVYHSGTEKAALELMKEAAEDDA